MLRIDLTGKKDLCFTGDIHGGFRNMTWSLLSQWCLEDSIVVVCGDIGMGFYKRGYYADEFQRMQTKLSEKNVTVVMFRGNHDNPDYFRAPQYGEYQFNGAYPNVFLVPDRTVLVTDHGKVACFGGAVSVDRSARTEDISWWHGENFAPLTESEYADISKESIDIVATHTCPLVCGPRFNDAMGYEKSDKFLMSELMNERMDLDDLLKNIKASNPLTKWFYGHFHGHYSDFIDGVQFTGMDMLKKSGADLYSLKGSNL